MQYQTKQYNVFCPFRPDHKNIVVESVTMGPDVPNAEGPGYGRFRRLWVNGTNYAYGTAGVPLTETGFDIPADGGQNYGRKFTWPDNYTDLERAWCVCRECRYSFDIELLLKDRKLAFEPPTTLTVPFGRDGGFTILERDASAGRDFVTFNTLWMPARALDKHEKEGTLFLAYSSFFQLNKDVTEAHYRIKGYRHTVVAWFNNATGERIA